MLIPLLHSGARSAHDLGTVCAKYSSVRSKRVVLEKVRTFDHSLLLSCEYYGAAVIVVESLVCADGKCKFSYEAVEEKCNQA